MATYTDFTVYIRCASDTREKIARIDSIIELLEDAELNNAIDAGQEEYSLDDGQTKIKVRLRDITNIEKAIQALIRRKTRLQNMCVGYRYGLRDGNVK